MPAEPVPPHDYDPASCSKQPRHKHGYRPPAGAAQRCPTGHRTFTLSIGGPTPPAVTCTTCKQLNRTATAYERGRVHALTAG